jgi:hypothetical protein
MTVLGRIGPAWKIAIVALAAWCMSARCEAEPNNPNTEWFKNARYGVFMHFLPGDDAGLKLVDSFDVPALVKQLEEVGAKYFVLTLGQNSGCFNSPNAAYCKRTGYAPGERCSRRDLPADLAKALGAKGIRLMLYLPCQVPNQDVRAQRAFGLAEGPKDQPLDAAFADKWAEVIQEWSDRYGDRVAGWWFDGGYRHIQFNEAIAARYAKAVKHGNPRAIVTFNPGVEVIHYTQAEDYTAGELNEPLSMIPKGRWLDGSQWHALTYVGNTWGQRNTRFSNAQWAQWARAVTTHEGVITFDMGPNYQPSAGPIGSLATEQVQQVKAVRQALADATKTAFPPRIPRAKSYFGIHFDFHAGDDCKEIGKNTTRAMVEKILDQAHPDYIQIDCKGHRGLSSYPTKAGNRAPGFVGDPLRVWRQITAERGVSLFMHYSGVWDSEAIRLHPDWAAVGSDGKPGPNATSFFGPYAERLLIPQLRELAGEYGVDGAWVDGECWASVPDYSEAALRAFRAATGIQDVPRKPGDPHWFEFLEFNRNAFRNYLKDYLQKVRSTHPAMQLCSNWAFTDHMPEKVCAPVDWISGDFSPQDAVNSARFSARYIAQQGKPWDLMAWGFTIAGEARNGSRIKSAVQMQREAAIVLALGGGFQSYYQQRRDGSVPEDYLPVIAEVAKFCRARQAVCQGARPVPQIALLYSTASHYREINGLFHRDVSRISGALEALLAGQQVVDVVGEHHLAGRMKAYPLIVVAECDYLEPAFRSELLDYVRGGGNLLLLGPSAASMFAAELGATLEGSPKSATHWLAHGGKLLATHDALQGAKLAAGAEAFGRLHTANDAASPSQPAASVATLGKGKIAATYFSLSRGYLANRSPVTSQFLNELVRRLFPTPTVEVRGSSVVDVSLVRLGDKLAVHLVNVTGPHWDAQKPLVDAIPPIGPIELSIRTPSKPAGLRLEPAGQPLAFEYRDGKAVCTVPKVEIHSVVVVE